MEVQRIRIPGSVAYNLVIYYMKEPAIILGGFLIARVIFIKMKVVLPGIRVTNDAWAMQFVNHVHGQF